MLCSFFFCCCIGFCVFFCVRYFAGGGERDEVGAEVFADGRGKDFFLQKAQVGKHLDEFLSRVVNIEVFLQHAGRGDKHTCCEVEVAGLMPEGNNLL